MNINFNLDDDRIYNEEEFFLMMIEQQLIDLFLRISEVNFEECISYHKIPYPKMVSMDIFSDIFAQYYKNSNLPYEFINNKESEYMEIYFNLAKLFSKVGVFKIENMSFQINHKDFIFAPIYKEIGHYRGSIYHMLTRKYSKDSNGNNISRLPNNRLFQYRFGKYIAEYLVNVGYIDENLDILDYLIVVIRDNDYIYDYKKTNFITYVFEWRTFDNNHILYKINGTIENMDINDKLIEISGIKYTDPNFPYFERN